MSDSLYDHNQLISAEKEGVCNGSIKQEYWGDIHNGTGHSGVTTCKGSYSHLYKALTAYIKLFRSMCNNAFYKTS